MKKENKDKMIKTTIDDSEIFRDESKLKPLPKRDEKKVDKIVEHLKQLIKKSEENK